MAEPDEPRSPPLGARVTLVNLAARADLNGKRGTVTGPPNRSTGRVPVTLEEDFARVALKVANLELVRKDQPEAAVVENGVLLQEEGRWANPRCTAAGFLLMCLYPAA